MAQVVIQRRALHDARTATRHDERATQILGQQERLLRDQARLTWSPAEDASWLARANLPQTGRAWASAASPADTDLLAASALRKCEDRLRTHAMARYDRLRSDGLRPLDAMQEAAPLFSRSPTSTSAIPYPPGPNSPPAPDSRPAPRMRQHLMRASAAARCAAGSSSGERDSAPEPTACQTTAPMS